MGCDNNETSISTGRMVVGEDTGRKYVHAPHNDVSVNDGPNIRRWSHNIITLTIVLQLPTVFSTVTCCTGL